MCKTQPRLPAQPATLITLADVTGLRTLSSTGKSPLFASCQPVPREKSNSSIKLTGINEIVCECRGMECVAWQQCGFITRQRSLTTRSLTSDSKYTFTIEVVSRCVLHSSTRQLTVAPDSSHQHQAAHSSTRQLSAAQVATFTCSVNWLISFTSLLGVAPAGIASCRTHTAR